MSSLWNILHKKKPLSGTFFGIELEVERPDGFGDEEYEGLSEYGQAVEDGSLRGGTEIVTKPLTPVQVQDFASWYDQWYEQAGVQLTERCSTHIHVNVQDMNAEQLRSFIWLSIATEEVLMMFTSEQRKNNTYCVSVRDSINLSRWWSDILYGFSNNSGIEQYLSHAPKYCAIGGFRLRDYGTVEFRMFDGLDQGSKLNDFCRVLESLRTLAMVTPVEKLLDDKIKKGVLSVLTPVILNNFPGDTTELSVLLERGIEMANDTTRRVLTEQEILAEHARLFPEEAPFVIVRGMFGRQILTMIQDQTLESILDKVQKKDFLVEYGNNGLQVLFFEMCDQNKQDDDHTITCVNIAQLIRKIWSL